MVASETAVILCSETRHDDESALRKCVQSISKNPNATVLPTPRCADSLAGKTVVAGCVSKVNGFVLRDYHYDWDVLKTDTNRIGCLKDGGS
jgi:hypothetical protein